MKSEYFKVLEGKNYGDLISETEYWFILLAPDQKNIGTCVVALKREEHDLAGLENEEWLELSKIVRSLQGTIKKAFNATMFNWGCLMNSSYLKDIPDPHVHWHFIPRYQNEVKFEGLNFKDPCFGSSTMKSKEEVREISKGVRIKIIEKIKDNFEI
ncbi:MAG: HIT family protein [Methanobacterium sp.]